MPGKKEKNGCDGMRRVEESARINEAKREESNRKRIGTLVKETREEIVKIGKGVIGATSKLE